MHRLTGSEILIYRGVVRHHRKPTGEDNPIVLRAMMEATRLTTAAPYLCGCRYARGQTEKQGRADAQGKPADVEPAGRAAHRHDAEHRERRLLFERLFCLYPCQRLSWPAARRTADHFGNINVVSKRMPQSGAVSGFSTQYLPSTPRLKGSLPIFTTWLTPPISGTVH